MNAWLWFTFAGCAVLVAILVGSLLRAPEAPVVDTETTNEQAA